MSKRAISFVIPAALAMLAGPVSFALGSVAQPDRANVYIVIGPRSVLTDVMSRPETREIGPYKAPFARIFHTSTEFHASLVSDGYWMFPATSFAAMCGVRLAT